MPKYAKTFKESVETGAWKYDPRVFGRFDAKEVREYMENRVGYCDPPLENRQDPKHPERGLTMRIQNLTKDAAWECSNPAGCPNEDNSRDFFGGATPSEKADPSATSSDVLRILLEILQGAGDICKLIEELSNLAGLDINLGGDFCKCSNKILKATINPNYKFKDAALSCCRDFRSEFGSLPVCSALQCSIDFSELSENASQGQKDAVFNRCCSVAEVAAGLRFCGCFKSVMDGDENAAASCCAAQRNLTKIPACEAYECFKKPGVKCCSRVLEAFPDLRQTKFAKSCRAILQCKEGIETGRDKFASCCSLSEIPEGSIEACSLKNCKDAIENDKPLTACCGLSEEARKIVQLPKNIDDICYTIGRCTTEIEGILASKPKSSDLLEAFKGSCCDTIENEVENMTSADIEGCSIAECIGHIASEEEGAIDRCCARASNIRGIDVCAARDCINNPTVACCDALKNFAGSNSTMFKLGNACRTITQCAEEISRLEKGQGAKDIIKNVPSCCNNPLIKIGAIDVCDAAKCAAGIASGQDPLGSCCNQIKDVTSVDACRIKNSIEKCLSNPTADCCSILSVADQNLASVCKCSLGIKDAIGLGSASGSGAIPDYGNIMSTAGSCCSSLTDGNNICRMAKCGADVLEQIQTGAGLDIPNSCCNSFPRGSIDVCAIKDCILNPGQRCCSALSPLNRRLGSVCNCALSVKDTMMRSETSGGLPDYAAIVAGNCCSTVAGNSEVCKMAKCGADVLRQIRNGSDGNVPNSCCRAFAKDSIKACRVVNFLQDPTKIDCSTITSLGLPLPFDCQKIQSCAFSLSQSAVTSQLFEQTEQNFGECCFLLKSAGVNTSLFPCGGF